MGIKVSLRQKKISKGRASLYLDFYPQIIHPSTGKPTRREFLGSYIIEKPSNNNDKVKNNQTLLIAEQIRHRRENELNKPEVYGEFEREILRLKSIGEEDYVKYFYKKTQKKRKVTLTDSNPDQETTFFFNSSNFFICQYYYVD
jgi:hypothetical protein